MESTGRIGILSSLPSLGLPRVSDSLHTSGHRRVSKRASLYHSDIISRWLAGGLAPYHKRRGDQKPTFRFISSERLSEPRFETLTKEGTGEEWKHVQLAVTALEGMDESAVLKTPSDLGHLLYIRCHAASQVEHLQHHHSLHSSLLPFRSISHFTIP